MASQGNYNPAVPTHYDSLVYFDVKPWDAEVDLSSLAQKISLLSIDGVSWLDTWKLIPLAFGINKLRIGCNIVDSKMSVDDICEKMNEFDDSVQAVDIVSFQKYPL